MSHLEEEKLDKQESNNLSNEADRDDDSSIELDDCPQSSVKEAPPSQISFGK